VPPRKDNGGRKEAGTKRGETHLQSSISRKPNRRVSSLPRRHRSQPSVNPRDSLLPHDRKSTVDETAVLGGGGFGIVDEFGPTEGRVSG
jgi:hypothetical protein